MSVPSVPDMELLLSHSGWVRTLARRLVGGESGADDLVQETWLAALAAGKAGARRAEVRSARAWLAGILSNLARETRRGEARRRAREELSAREPRRAVEPSVGDAFEAVSTGRELAGMVLELEEPFRTAVLLRYYEDLPPRRIAKRLGIPVRTVNSRLARGIERLRERWKLRERAAGPDGEAWARSLFVLAGPASTLTTTAASAAGVALPIGVVLMNAKIWLGAALLGAGAVAWWLSNPGTETRGGPALAERAESAARPGLSRAEQPLVPAVSGVERAPAGAPPAAAAPESPAERAAATRLLRGRVLDPEARPVGAVEVGAWIGGDPEPLSATSGPDGVFELEVPRGSGELRALDPSLVTVMSGRVNERTEVEPLVVVARRIELAGVTLDAAGAPLGEVRVRFEHPRGFGARFEAVLDATEGAEWKTRSDERGRFELAPVPSIAGAFLVAELEGFEPWRGEVPWDGDRNLVLTLFWSTAAVPAITGRVVDPEYRAVAGAWVSLGSRSTATDAAGEFRLEREDALDSFELRALKNGYRMATLRAVEDSGGRPLWPSHVVLVLGPPPLSLRGRVVGARGEPRPGMVLWIADPTPFGVLEDDMEASAEYFLGDPAHGDAYWHSQETDPEGRFQVDGLLEREYALSVMNRRTLETITAGPFRPGEEAVEVVFTGGALGRVGGRVVARDGRGLSGVTLTIRGNAFGGIWLDAGSTVSDGEGRFAFEGVGGQTLMLSVAGDQVVPGWFPAALERGGETDLVLAVDVRCTFQVDMGAAAARADAVRVLDQDGEEMMLCRVGPGGSLHANEFPLVEGRSESLGVGESARTLVLLKGGLEVLRVPIALRAGTLNLVTP